MRLLFVVVVAGLLACAALAANGRQVDLATGDLDGKQILGRSVADVKAALGKPDFTASAWKGRVLDASGICSVATQGRCKRPSGPLIPTNMSSFARMAVAGQVFGRASSRRGTRTCTSASVGTPSAEEPSGSGCRS
jgi:hypothetical protein